MTFTRKSLIALMGFIWAMTLVVSWTFSPMYHKLENEHQYAELRAKIDNSVSEMNSMEARLHERYDALHRNDVALAKCTDTLGRLNLNENQKLDIIISILTNHFDNVEVITKPTE